MIKGVTEIALTEESSEQLKEFASKLIERAQEHEKAGSCAESRAMRAAAKHLEMAAQELARIGC